MKGTDDILSVKEFTSSIAAVYLYVPPIRWQGDRKGHLGVNNAFFYVVKGECYLEIDGESFIAGAGQLTFLPKDKMRTYTRISKEFSMYEIDFTLFADGEDLFDKLKLCDGDFTVSCADSERMMKLFENSLLHEANKSTVHDITAVSNLLAIASEYISLRMSSDKSRLPFSDTVEYMKRNLDKNVSLEELAKISYMQPTYFIKKFGEVYGRSPKAYYAQLKIYKAMQYLSRDMSVDETAKNVGIYDNAYFSRFFKKHTGMTPIEYRAIFRK